MSSKSIKSLAAKAKLVNEINKLNKVKEGMAGAASVDQTLANLQKQLAEAKAAKKTPVKPGQKRHPAIQKALDVAVANISAKQAPAKVPAMPAPRAKGEEKRDLVAKLIALMDLPQSALASTSTRLDSLTLEELREEIKVREEKPEPVQRVVPEMPAPQKRYQSKTDPDSKYHNRDRSLATKPVSIVRAFCEKNIGMPRKDIIELCIRAGVNKNTAATQYSMWKAARRTNP